MHTQAQAQAQPTHPFESYGVRAVPVYDHEGPDLTQTREYQRAYTLLRGTMRGYARIIAATPLIVTSKLPTAGTDGVYLYVNPAYFLQLRSDGERAALLAHEAGHIALRHPLRSMGYQRKGTGPDGLPFSPRAYNVAGDKVLNADIRASGLPLGEGWIYDASVTRDDVIDHVYTNDRAQQPQPPQEVNPGQGDDGQGDQGEPQDGQGDQGQGDQGDGDQGQGDQGDESGHDAHLTPRYVGTPSERAEAMQEDAERVERMTDQAAQEQAQAAKEDGKLPPSAELASAGRLAEAARVDWRTELADYVTRSGRGGDQTYKRINARRFALYGTVCPTHTARLGLLAVTVDGSASVCDVAFDQFIRELAALVDTMQPESVIVLITTTKVQRVHEVTTGAELLEIPRSARGGTSMCEGPRWLEANGYDPDVHLIFTDGEMYAADWIECHRSGARIVLDGEPCNMAREGMAASGHTPLIVRND